AEAEPAVAARLAATESAAKSRRAISPVCFGWLFWFSMFGSCFQECIASSPEINVSTATPRPVSPLDIAGGFKHMKRFTFMTVIVAGLAVTGLTAQEIKERKENQQDRIAQGVKSGQLTAGETARLEAKEARLNREIRHDRKQ